MGLDYSPMTLRVEKVVYTGAVYVPSVAGVLCSLDLHYVMKSHRLEGSYVALTRFFCCTHTTPRNTHRTPHPSGRATYPYRTGRMGVSESEHKR
jgi:hypothetical protein